MMAGRTLEELRAKYPPADRDANDQARAAAILAGGLAELQIISNRLCSVA